MQHWVYNAPIKIIWLGPGYGLANVPKENKEGYKIITQKMVDRSYATFTEEIKSFNVFATHEKFNREIGIKTNQEEKIRENLKTYIEAKDPIKLPKEMRAGPPQEEKMEDVRRVCFACQKEGHGHIICQAQEGNQNPEGEAEQLWGLIHLLTMDGSMSQ